MVEREPSTWRSESEGDVGDLESQEQPGEFIYHLVPKGQEGSELIPLNDMQEEYPEVYERAVAKYQGREHVMNQVIPQLGAKWNDVLHFSAVNPREVKRAVEEAGGTFPEGQWYKIPKSIIRSENAVIYRGESPSGTIKKEEVEPFDVNNLAQHATLPGDIRQYYESAVEQGKRPLLFLGIPHVLYKGRINTDGLEKITL